MIERRLQRTARGEFIGVRRGVALAALALCSIGTACGSEDGQSEGAGEPRAARDAAEAQAFQAASGASATTYTEHVRPILTRTCVSCHGPNKNAPFGLDSYAQAKTLAPQIARAARARTMPPYSIDNSG